jgi:hypothetical protein
MSTVEILRAIAESARNTPEPDEISSFFVSRLEQIVRNIEQGKSQDYEINETDYNMVQEFLSIVAQTSGIEEHFNQHHQSL